MHFMHEICRVANAHQRTSSINIILPSIQLFIILQRKEHPLVFGFEEETVRFEVGAFDVRDVGEGDEGLGLNGGLDDRSG